MYAQSEQIKHYAFKEPSNNEEAIVKERIDNENNRFKKAINDDIINAFKLDLDGYVELSNKEFSDDVKYKSLYTIYFDVIENQVSGDVLPSIFIKDSKGYILEKKADGSNYIYELEYTNNNWTLKNTMNQNGKIILYEEVNSKK